MSGRRRVEKERAALGDRKKKKYAKTQWRRVPGDSKENQNK